MKHFDDDDVSVKELEDLKNKIISSISRHSAGLGGLTVDLFGRLANQAKWVIILLSLNAFVLAVITGLMVYNLIKA